MTRTGTTERGRRTRARVVEAATRLFLELGYLETTMAAIASGAGVAVQTVYLAFGSKVAVLSASHDAAVVGDDEPVPVLERAWVAEVRDESDGPRALQILMTNALSVVERVSPIYGVIQAAAADHDVAELLTDTKAQRLHTLRALASELTTKAGFAAGVSAEWAADVLYVIISDELHRLLVIERRWTPHAWRAWAYESALMRLFPTITATTPS